MVHPHVESMYLATSCLCTDEEVNNIPQWFPRKQSTGASECRSQWREFSHNQKVFLYVYNYYTQTGNRYYIPCCRLCTVCDKCSCFQRIVAIHNTGPILTLKAILEVTLLINWRLLYSLVGTLLTRIAWGLIVVACMCVSVV